MSTLTLACRRCQQGAMWSLTDGWPKHVYNVSPTGRRRVKATVGRRHRVPQMEVQCGKGHVWWSSHPEAVQP